MVKTRLNQINISQGVIFDGIPRRLGQAEFLTGFLEKQGRKDFITLYVTLPKEESVKRIMARAEKEKRADDTMEKVEYRLQQYYNETLPVVDYLKQHTQFFEIDGRPNIEEVATEINRALAL